MATYTSSLDPTRADPRRMDRAPMAAELGGDAMGMQGMGDDELSPSREGTEEASITAGYGYRSDFGRREMDGRTILDEHRADYDAMQDYRKRRKRSRDYMRGRQWSEEIEDPTQRGKRITEEEHIKRQGRVPWQMNHVSPVIRNLKGQMLQNRSERMAYAENRKDDDASEQMTVALRGARRLNRARVLEADNFEEHLVSGLHAWKVTADWHDRTQREEVFIDQVKPTRFAFNQDILDRRGTGLRRITEIHDVTLDELVSKMASTEEEAEELVKHYQVYRGAKGGPGLQGHALDDRADFDHQPDPEKARVYECWRTEYRWVSAVHDYATGEMGLSDVSEQEVAEENAARAAMGIPLVEMERRYDEVWVAYFITPQGKILDRIETTYWHEEHPYIIGFASFLDGEYWSLVEDIIDPQRLINRITASIDHQIGASAKGVLFVDEDVVEQSEMDLDEIAEEWTSFRGVVSLRLKPGLRMDDQLRQITSNAIPSGLFQWLQEQKAWIQELSGVTAAQQGHKPPSGTAASLYAQQQQQSALTTMVYLDSFFQALYELDLKVIKTIQQFYREDRMISTDQHSEPVAYAPEQVRELEFAVVIGDTQDTITLRMAFEESLQAWLGEGHLTFRQYLEMSSHPKAGQIMQMMDQTNPLIDQGQQIQDPQMAGELMRRAADGDMEAAALLQQAQQAPPPA